MPTMTLNEVAEIASDAFETAKRADGESFTRLKQDAPEWVTELVREAHGDFLPDDWRYSCIRNAVDWIRIEGDGEPDADEFAESEVDVYTGAALAWLSSNLRRVGYCDEAIAEFGGFTDSEYGRGGGEAVSITTLIAQGQYLEAQEVFESVLASLEAQADA